MLGKGRVSTHSKQIDRKTGQNDPCESNPTPSLQPQQHLLHHNTVLCVLDYFIFGTVSRGKAKQGLCGNVTQLATEGAAQGQTQEVLLAGYAGLAWPQSTWAA